MTETQIIYAIRSNRRLNRKWNKMDLSERRELVNEIVNNGGVIGEYFEKGKSENAV